MPTGDVSVEEIQRYVSGEYLVDEPEEEERKMHTYCHVLLHELAEANKEVEEQSWEIAKLRYYTEALERMLTKEQRNNAATEASAALELHNPPKTLPKSSPVSVEIVNALVDYYYNSLPKNETALAAAKILDPWMEKQG